MQLNVLINFRKILRQESSLLSYVYVTCKSVRSVFQVIL